jgi:hypothetical protein
MVPEAGYEPARQLLLDAEMVSNGAVPDALPGIGSPGRLLIWVLVAVAIAVALVWALYQATG